MEYCTGNILNTSRLLVPEDLAKERCCWLHLLIGQFLNSFKVKLIILFFSYNNLGWKEFLEVIQVCFLLWTRVTLMARLRWPLSIQMVKTPKDGDSTVSLPTLRGIRFCVKFFHYLNYLKLLFLASNWIDFLKDRLMLDIFLPLLSSSYSMSVAANGSWTPQPGKRLASHIVLKKNFHIHMSWTVSGILMENYCREILFLYLPVHKHIEKAGLIAQTVNTSGTVQKAFQIVLFKTSLRLNFTSCFAFFFWNNLSQKNLKVCVVSELCIFQSGILMSSAKMLHRLVLSTSCIPPVKCMSHCTL